MISELSTFQIKTRICEKNGFTLIEVLIALVILSIGILGVAQMQISAIQGNANARKRSEILIAAQKQIEEMMQEPYEDLKDDDTLGHSDDNTIPEDYTLKYIVTSTSSGECKKIEVSMSPVTVYENRIQPTANITFLKAKDFK